MYEIHIESNEFKGKRTVQQHQLVNQVITITPAYNLWDYKIIISPKLCMLCCCVFYSC